MNRFEISDAEKLDWTGTINNVNRFSTIPNVVSGLRVKSNTCNEEISTVDLSRFDFVKKVDIGSNSLQHAQQLTMNGLNKLTEVNIGEGVMTSVDEIAIGSNSLNALPSFNFTGFSNVTNIHIGNNSMNVVTNVIASGLNELEKIEVGDDSLMIATAYVL